MDNLISCSDSLCKVSETGKCLEGFTVLSECTNYGEDLTELATEVQITNNVEDAITESEYVDIHSGDTLKPQVADSLLRKFGGKVVACIGPSNIGKTTLLASIYELFNLGPTELFLFGGSQTLYAFEEICHHSRATSNNEKPTTARTMRANEVYFYHLALQQRNDNQRIDILLGDRAGEEYEAAIDSSESCISLFEVSRADVLLILVDAEALGNLQKRHVAKNHTENLVRSLIEEDMLNRHTKVLIVMTRYDLTFKNEQQALATEELTKLTEKITGWLSDIHITVNSHIIAARPDCTEHVECGFGIPGLIQDIVKDNTNLIDRIIEKPIIKLRNFHRIKAE